YRPSIRNQARPISRLRRDHSQREGGIYREIEFGGRKWTPCHLDLRSQQTAGIHHKPDCLAPLHSIRARDRVVAPRRCGPADIAQFVTGTIVSQAIEVASVAPLAPPALLHFNLTASDQEQREFPRLRH